MFSIQELIINGTRFTLSGSWNERSKSFLGWGKVTWSNESDPNLTYSVKGRLDLSEESRILVSGIAVLQHYDGLGRLCFEEKGIVDLRVNDVDKLQFSVSLQSFYEESELSRIKMNHSSIISYDGLLSTLQQFQQINDYFNGMIHDLILKHSDKIDGFDSDLTTFLSDPSNQSLQGFFRYIGKHRHKVYFPGDLSYKCGDEDEETVRLSNSSIGIMPPSEHEPSELSRILFFASTSEDSGWDVVHRKCISIQGTPYSLKATHRAVRDDLNKSTNEQWSHCTYEESYLSNLNSQRRFHSVVYEKKPHLPSRNDYALMRTTIFDYESNYYFPTAKFGVVHSLTLTAYRGARAVSVDTESGNLYGVRTLPWSIPASLQSNLGLFHPDIWIRIIDKKGASAHLTRNAIATKGTYQLEQPSLVNPMVYQEKGIINQGKWSEVESSFVDFNPKTTVSECVEVDESTPADVCISSAMVLHNRSATAFTLNSNETSMDELPMEETVETASDRAVSEGIEAEDEFSIPKDDLHPEQVSSALAQQEFWFWLRQFQASVSDSCDSPVANFSPLMNFLMANWHNTKQVRTHDLQDSNLKMLNNFQELCHWLTPSIANIVKCEGIRYEYGLLRQASFFNAEKRNLVPRVFKLDDERSLVLQPDCNQDSPIYDYHIQPYPMLEKLKELLIHSHPEEFKLKRSADLYFLMIRLLAWPDVCRQRGKVLPTNNIAMAQFVKSDAFIEYLIQVVQDSDTEHYINLLDSCFHWSSMSSRSVDDIVAKILRIILTTPGQQINYAAYLMLMNGAPFPQDRFKGTPIQKSGVNGFFTHASEESNALPADSDFFSLFRRHHLYGKIEALAHNMPENHDALILLAYILGQMAHDAISGNPNKYNPQYNPLVTCIGLRHALCHGIHYSTGLLQRAIDEARSLVALICPSPEVAYGFTGM